MRCLDDGALARAATTGDEPAHAADCLVCRRALAAQRAMRALLQAAPAPRFAPARKLALKAETLASAGEPAPTRSYLPVGVALAIAAAVALVVQRGPRPEAASIDVSSVEESPTAVRLVQRDAPPPSAVASVPVRAPVAQARALDVVVGAARAERTPILDRDASWTAARSAFRDGWLALREGRNRDARALFDRATAPDVVEEAMYWAAVAARRDGDHLDAEHRFAEFRERFPRSPYADRARRALEQP